MAGISADELLFLVKYNGFDSWQIKQGLPCDIVQEYIALGVFAIVYTLIIGRRRFGVPIWVAMLIGAALMIALQVIDVRAAFMSVNLDVIAFLFGMFTIVSALDRAGVLQRVAIRICLWWRRHLIGF